MLAGGRDENDEMLSSVEILNTEGGQWQSAEDMPAATVFHCHYSFLVSKMQFLVKKSIFGGRGNTAAFGLNTGTTPWIWDIPSNTYYSEPILGRRLHGCLEWYEYGYIILVGGLDGTGASLQQVRTMEWFSEDLSYASYSGTLPADINVSGIW